MSDVVWVTGAAGFTGQHLIAFLRHTRPSLRIVGVDVREAPLSAVNAQHHVDLNDVASVRALAIAEPPRWVIHLAGLLPPSAEPEMWRANVGGSVGLLVGLGAADCQQTRVVSIGSAAEYALDATNPISEDARCGPASVYGKSKLAQSLTCLRLAADTGLGALVARTFNLIGPGLSTHLVAGSLTRQFASRAPCIQIGNTHTARDFIDVRDAVRAYWLLALDGHIGQIYNVSSQTPVRIADLLTILARLTGHAPYMETDPARLRPGDPPVVVGDSTKLRHATSWLPEIHLERSLREMLAGK
jgi:GDP-4-dehydro-6-deoxy-D-mannose reductase